jgi:adenine-specific DNA-methyltransferase
MVSLAEKEGLKGKVQTIYFDPPYGIKFGSNWQVSTRKRDVKDGKAEDATRQPEQVRAFRDTWKLLIHSYLAYLRDRLVVAQDLLVTNCKHKPPKPQTMTHFKPHSMRMGGCRKPL